MSLHIQPELSVPPKHFPALSLLTPSRSVSCGGAQASLVFQCLPGLSCSGGPARGCAHHTPPGRRVCIEGLDWMTLVSSFQLSTLCDPMRDPLPPCFPGAFPRVPKDAPRSDRARGRRQGAASPQPPRRGGRPGAPRRAGRGGRRRGAGRAPGEAGRGGRAALRAAPGGAGAGPRCGRGGGGPAAGAPAGGTGRLPRAPPRAPPPRSVRRRRCC